MTSPFKALLSAGSNAALRTALAASLLTLVACGGGSGSSGPEPRYSGFSSSSISFRSSSSSSSAPVGPDLTWTKGVYADADDFWSLCENPRSGIAPYNDLPYPDQAGSSAAENFFLRSLTHDYYLWYDEVADIDPALYSTADYFAQMKTTARTPTGTLKDQFHWSDNTAEYRKRNESGLEAGYGAVWVMISPAPPRQALVSYVQPNSPAAQQGLSRGAQILEIDGVDFINDNTKTGVETLSTGLYPEALNESHTFKLLDLNASNPRTVTLTSAETTIAPTPTVKTLATSSGKVGYILFNSHIATAETALANAIEQLRSAGVNDLVLDIRYNGGGYLDIANQLAYMIAGDKARNKTFSTIQFNDKHPSIDPFTGYDLTPQAFHSTTLGFSESGGQALPTLNLNRVYVLTGGNTCSASESIINGLRGIDVDVVQIGTATCGKPYGAYMVDNCGESYFTVQFKSANAKGYGEYSDGFFPGGAASSNPAELPGCQIGDDYTHLLGDPSEARLAAALHYRKTGSCPAVPTSKGQSSAQKFHSNAHTSDEGKIRQPRGLGDMILRR